MPRRHKIIYLGLITVGIGVALAVSRAFPRHYEWALLVLLMFLAMSTIAIRKWLPADAFNMTPRSEATALLASLVGLALGHVSAHLLGWSSLSWSTELRHWLVSAVLFMGILLLSNVIARRLTPLADLPLDSTDDDP